MNNNNSHPLAHPPAVGRSMLWVGAIAALALLAYFAVVVQELSQRGADMRAHQRIAHGMKGVSATVSTSSASVAGPDIDRAAVLAQR
jgi:hypothetical protein